MHKKLWNKDYILLLQSNAVSTIGDLMYSVAIGYWVYEQTGSSGLMGIMSSISMFVTMFLSPFCGSIVDKCNRKSLIMTIDTLQGLLMVTVGILAYRNALRVPIVLLVALLAAFGSVFYSPCISTLMLDIIPRHDMVRGQSIHSSINSLIDLLGTAFSGAMVAFFGVPLIVIINGLSNLYSAFTELFIQVPPTVQQGQPVTLKQIFLDTHSAVSTILSNDFLRLFVISALILNLLGSGPFNLLLPFCLEKGFTVDMYGYLVAAYSVGSLLCVVTLGIVKLSPKARFWVMALGFPFSVLFLTPAYLSDRFIPMFILSFLAGLSNCAGNSIFNASMMLALPQANRSSILGFLRSASIGGCALSAVIYGFLGDIFPLYLVFAVGAILSLAPMLFLCFHPKTREFILEHCD